MLKSGISVPCGKCEVCRSDARNEWSIRLALHLQNCDRMPMFITLTYRDEDVPFVYSTPNNEFFWNRGYPTHKDAMPSLYREDVSKFLKAYKRKYKLDNETFQYFGCGEYGENYRRPHYHLLFFGDFQLYIPFEL